MNEPNSGPAGHRIVDDIDEKIVWELRRDARITNNELATRVGVSPSTSLARVKVLQNTGVLRKAHIQYDLVALGLHLQAVVAVRLRPPTRGRTKAYAARAVKLTNVINVFFLGGPDDFLIHVACTSSEQLRDFVSSELADDPDVASTQTFIVFDHFLGAEHMDHVPGFEDMRKPLA